MLVENICPSANGNVCSGSGTCVCAVCNCQARYSGADCSIYGNTAPSVLSPVKWAFAEKSIGGIITINSEDDEGDAVAPMIVSQPAKGLLRVQAGVLLYDADSYYDGITTFQFRVCETQTANRLCSAVVTGTINVTYVADAPISQNISITVNEEAATTPISLANYVTDYDQPYGDTPDKWTFTAVEVITAKAAKGYAGSKGNVNTAQLRSNGIFVFTGLIDQTGLATFQYTISDADGLTSSSYININIVPVNDPPTVYDQAITTKMEQSVLFQLSATDPDPGQMTTFTAPSQRSPSSGSVTCTTAGACTYNPIYNFYGTDSFSFSAMDSLGARSVSEGSVYVTVAKVNFAPIASSGSSWASARVPLQSQVSYTDRDTPDSLLTVLLSGSGPKYGTLSAFGQPPGSTSGGFIYTFNTKYISSITQDSFQFFVKDNTGMASSIATWSIQINPNTTVPPRASGGAIAMDENANGIKQALSCTAAQTESVSIKYVLAQSPANGNVVLDSSTGSYVYNPAYNFYGSDQLKFKCNDGYLDSNTATIDITVRFVNHQPLALGDQFTFNSESLYLRRLYGTDVETPASQLSFAVKTSPRNAKAFTLYANGSFTYLSNDLFFGSDSFTFSVDDNSGALLHESEAATVTLSILRVNHPPKAIAATFKMNEDGTLSGNFPQAIDPDDTVFTYLALTSAKQGRLTTNPGSNTFTYIPNPLFFGQDTFSYRVSDPYNAYDDATVTISVAHVNHAPTAITTAITTNQNQAFAGQLEAADVDAQDTLRFFLVSYDAVNGLGAVTVSQSGLLSYTPQHNVYGTDVFTYAVSDGAGGQAVRDVTVTVNHVNQPPITSPSSCSGNRYDTIVCPLLASDPDNDALTYQVLSHPSTSNAAIIGNNLYFQSFVSSNISTCVASHVASYNYSIQVADDNNATNITTEVVFANATICDQVSFQESLFNVIFQASDKQYDSSSYVQIKVGAIAHFHH